MGSLPRTFTGVRGAIGSLFDLLDFLSYFNVILSVGSGGGAVIGWLCSIPTWVIVLLIVVFVASTVVTVTRILVRYRKWLATKEERKACLDIPVIMQKMLHRLNSLTNEYARSCIDASHFQEAVYQFGMDMLRDRPELLRKVLARKPKLKHTREFVTILASYFHEYDIGLKRIRDNDTNDGTGYQALRERLAELTKTMENEKIEDDINDTLNLLYESCFAQLYQRQFLGAEDKPAQARLSVKYDAMNEALLKRIFKIRKKVLRYWLWEI